MREERHTKSTQENTPDFSEEELGLKPLPEEQDLSELENVPLVLSVKQANDLAAALKDGDSVTVAKDLKAGKGTIKAGTKVKNIRLLDEPVNGHDISCKVDGHGSMYLKCSVVKKA